MEVGVSTIKAGTALGGVITVAVVGVDGLVNFMEVMLAEKFLEGVFDGFWGVSISCEGTRGGVPCIFFEEGKVEVSSQPQEGVG